MERLTGRPLSERVTVRSTTFFRVSVSEANRTPPFSSIVTNCGSAARTAGAAMRARVVEMWQCMGEPRNGLMEIIAGRAVSLYASNATVTHWPAVALTAD